jgi:hypothetical protein
MFARFWRASLNCTDLLALSAGIRAMGVDAKTCRSLEEAKAMADDVVNAIDNPADTMKLSFIAADLPRDYERSALEKWRSAGYPPLPAYAPYAAHVLSVEIFFRVALAAGLISTERASNRVDMAYLFYLPFCMLFTSSDRLHRRCTPLFLRSDQDFVWGGDLKADMKRLNEHYLTLPESDREAGITRFASRPPETGDYLTSRLWDRHFRSWRGASAFSPEKRDAAKDKKLIERLTKFSDLPSQEVDFGGKDADMIVIKREVHKRKGSWYQLPKGLKERD